MTVMILFTQVTAIYLPTLLFFMILILLASIREMRSEGSQFMQKLIDEKPSAYSSEFPDHSSSSGFHIVIWKLRWDPSIINTFIIAHMTCKLRTRTLDKCLASKSCRHVPFSSEITPGKYAKLKQKAEYGSNPSPYSKSCNAPCWLIQLGVLGPGNSSILYWGGVEEDMLPKTLVREEEEEGKEDAEVAEVWEDGGAGPVTGTAWPWCYQW
ncbi:hypothetical protein CK203_066916 [Vitis vinifera]|uniref:Uncharacterized protein n=1 Tax=Vitis vinifera TaxID=29760 RepID=A0A438F531_VITVI|nr:hypothetical protein CK203_066916 [Vitis vinifera]